MSTTATVETLTASVHVLMVGNRQITLSVARQLDREAYSALEPMGRVRLSNDLGCHIIGRRLADGALVIAAHPEGGYWELPELRDGVTVCSRVKRSKRRQTHWLVDLPNARQAFVLDTAETRCKVEHRAHWTSPNSADVHTWDPSHSAITGHQGPWTHHPETPQCEPAVDWQDGAEVAAVRVWDQLKSDYQHDESELREAQALPLIVLAGLR